MKKNLWIVYGLRKIGTYDYRYVGISTKGVRRRLSQHIGDAKRGSTYPVHRWISKVGNAVVADILEVCPENNKELLTFREQFWIASLREAGYFLLNLTDGGDSTWGYRHSEEQKLKWSEDRKGTNSGISNTNYGKFGPDHPAYGRVYSPETLERLSKAKRGANNPNFGKVYTQQEKDIRSLKLKGVPQPKSRASAHKRYHVYRQGYSDKCKFCIGELNIEDYT